MNAPDKALEIKGTITAILAMLTTLWGWTGWAVVIWLACIAVDYVAGTVAARAAGEWSSSIARAGLWHKLGEIFAVLVAALCDIALTVVVSGAGLELPIDVGPLITPVVLLWYIITELGSIIENAGKLGAPVPSWLRKSLKQYKDTIDAKHGGDDETPQAPALDAPQTKEYRPQHELPDDPYADLKKAYEDERDHSGLLDEDE